MRGVFAVKEVVDKGNLGLALRGTVLSGQLIPGMEARSGYSVIIISQLVNDSKDGAAHKRARKGESILLYPLQLVFEVMKATEGTELKFEDTRTIPEKKSLILEPDLT
jgi:activator of HSP90 ATPase